MMTCCSQHLGWPGEKRVNSSSLEQQSHDHVNEHFINIFFDETSAIWQNFYWLLFCGVYLMLNQRWFNKHWLRTYQATSYHLNSWWPSSPICIYIYICMSPGLNELKQVTITHNTIQYMYNHASNDVFSSQNESVAAFPSDTQQYVFSCNTTPHAIQQLYRLWNLKIIRTIFRSFYEMMKAV